jgi:hypothetical protein
MWSQCLTLLNSREESQSDAWITFKIRLYLRLACLGGRAGSEVESAIRDISFFANTTKVHQTVALHLLVLNRIVLGPLTRKECRNNKGAIYIQLACLLKIVGGLGFG